jgi:hypothetical protein
MNQFTITTFVFWFLLIFNIGFSYIFIDTLLTELANNRIKKDSPNWPVSKGIIEEARIIEKEAETEENTGTADGETIHEYLPQIVFSYYINGIRFTDSTKTCFGRFMYISNAINKLKQLIGDREFIIYKRGKKLNDEEFDYLKQVRTVANTKKQEITINVNPNNPHETNLGVSPEKNSPYIILGGFFLFVTIATMIFFPYKLSLPLRINTVVVVNITLIILYFLFGKRFIPEYKKFEPFGKKIIVNNSIQCKEWIPFLDENYPNNLSDPNLPPCNDQVK